MSQLISQLCSIVGMRQEWNAIFSQSSSGSVSTGSTLAATANSKENVPPSASYGHGGDRKGFKYQRQAKQEAAKRERASKAGSSWTPPSNFNPETAYQESTEEELLVQALKEVEEEHQRFRRQGLNSMKKRKIDTCTGPEEESVRHIAGDYSSRKKVKSLSLFHATASHSDLSYSTVDSDEEEMLNEEETNICSDDEPDGYESDGDERSVDSISSTSSTDRWNSLYMKGGGAVANTLQSFSQCLRKKIPFLNPSDFDKSGKPYSGTEPQLIDIRKRNEYTFRNPVSACQTDYLDYGKPLAPDRFYQSFMVIRVWDPPEEFPLVKLRGGMRCPRCSSQSRPNRWKSNPRRIVGDGEIIYLFAREYKCLNSPCGMEFMSSSEEALAKLDVGHLLSFPYYLSTRSGVPVSTIQRIRSQIALGCGPRKIHNHYREMFCEKVSLVEKMYYGLVQCLLQGGRSATLTELPVKDARNEVPRFISRVDDVRGISGVILSECYIKRLFILDSRRRKEFLAFDRMRRDGQILSIDHTFRAAKRIGDSSSKSIHDVMNENGEIRSLVVTHDQSNSVVQEQLGAINHNIHALQQKEVSVVYSDNCCSVAAMLMTVFESLRRGTNHKPLYKPDMMHVKYQQLEGGFAAAAILDNLKQEVEKATESVLVGLDIEYTTIAEKDRDPGGVTTRVTTIQLAYVYHDDDDKEVVEARVFYRMPRSKEGDSGQSNDNIGLPQALVDLLKSDKVTLCGRSIKGDATHLLKNFGLELNANRLWCLEQRFFESKYPLITSSNLSLSALAESVLGYSLNKDEGMRRSFTGVKKLSETQAAYCAQDAMISLKLGLALQKWNYAYQAQEVPVDSNVHLCGSRCKLDAIHAMWRVTDSIPKEHTYRRLFMVQLVDAIMTPFNEDVELYDSKYGSGSYERDRVFRREFVNKVVRRYVPKEQVLESRLRTLLNDFGHAVFTCPKSGDPLLNAKAKDGLASLIRNHLPCLEDPPSSVCTLYTEYGKNKEGMPLYYCARGTNCLENFHRKLNYALTSYSLGAEMTDAILAELVNRQNIKMGERRRKDFAKAGHYNHELLEDIETLTKSIYGESVRQSLSANVGSYKDVKEKLMDEPFGIISCVLPDPQYELELEKKGGKAYLKSLPSDDAYLVVKQKQIIPYRPVNKRIEKYVFKVVCKSFVGNHGVVNFSTFAQHWNEGLFMRKLKSELRGTSNNTKVEALKCLKKYVEGDYKPDISCGVYMKTEEQLEAYYKVFKSNEELSEMTHLAAINIDELRKKLKQKPSQLIASVIPETVVEEDVDVVPTASSRELPKLGPSAEHLASNVDLPSMDIVVNPEQVMTAVTNIEVLAVAAEEVEVALRIRKSRTCRRCKMTGCKGSSNLGISWCEGLCFNCKEDCLESRGNYGCVKAAPAVGVIPSIATSAAVIPQIVLQGAKRGGKSVAKQTCKICGHVWDAQKKVGCKGAVNGENHCWLRGSAAVIPYHVNSLPAPQGAVSGESQCNDYKPPPALIKRAQPLMVSAKGVSAPKVTASSSKAPKLSAPSVSSSSGKVSAIDSDLIYFPEDSFDSPALQDKRKYWETCWWKLKNLEQTINDAPLDFNRIKNLGTWLSDNNVNIFADLLSVLEEAKPVENSYAVYSSWFIAQIKSAPRTAQRYSRHHPNLVKRKGIIMPANWGNSHWTLVVVVFKAKRIIHIDSYHTALSREYQELLLDYVKDEFSKGGAHFVRDEWGVEAHPDCPTQTNSCDCGVFTIMAAMSVCNYIGFDHYPTTISGYTEEQMPLIRSRMYNFVEMLRKNMKRDSDKTTNIPKLVTSMNAYLYSRIEVLLPHNLIDTFEQAALVNTMTAPDGIETLGLLFGKMLNGKYLITDLLIPKQEGRSDECYPTQAGEREMENYEARMKVKPLGWIHTHPQHRCFMSSVDLHAHLPYQVKLPEAIAIVIAPTDRAKRVGIFNLVDPRGLQTIGSCNERNFHSHDEPYPIFCEASHVTTLSPNDKIPLRVVDFRSV